MESTVMTLILVAILFLTIGFVALCFVFIFDRKNSKDPYSLLESVLDSYIEQKALLEAIRVQLDQMDSQLFSIGEIDAELLEDSYNLVDENAKMTESINTSIEEGRESYEHIYDQYLDIVRRLNSLGLNTIQMKDYIEKEKDIYDSVGM